MSKADEFEAKIRSSLDKHLGLKLAILFGSRVNGVANAMSDVDLLVEGEFSEAKLIMDLAEALNIPVEKIDLVRVKQLPIKVLARVLGCGVVVLCRDPKLLVEITEKVAVSFPEVMDSYSLNVKYSLDPEDKVDEVRLLALLNNVIDRSKFLKKLLNKHGIEDFKMDEVLDSALRWSIYEIAQSMIDVCALAASNLKLGLAESYKDYVVALVKGNVMGEELGSSLIELVSLRNKLAHRYIHVETEELFGGAMRLLDEIVPAFREWVYTTIKKFR
jgi:uncharacterized protein YutE (UPF0331/DUF86 family)/predicted nucleotidyltransferase